MYAISLQCWQAVQPCPQHRCVGPSRYASSGLWRNVPAAVAKHAAGFEEVELVTGQAEGRKLTKLL